MMMISPSRMAIRAMGLAEGGSESMPDGPPGMCSYCGAPILPGERCEQMQPKHTFTNHLAMARPGGLLTCGACVTILNNNAFLGTLGTSCITETALYPLAKSAHRASILLDPPPPPFAIVIQASRQQHAIWRAPVTLSRDMILVLHGDTLMRIRRPVLLAARQACLDIHEREVMPGIKGRDKAAVVKAETPFLIDGKREFLRAGAPRRWYDRLRLLGRIRPEEAALLSSLTPGEAWAMHCVLTPAERPAPLSMPASPATSKKGADHDAEE